MSPNSIFLEEMADIIFAVQESPEWILVPTSNNDARKLISNGMGRFPSR